MNRIQNDKVLDGNKTEGFVVRQSDDYAYMIYIKRVTMMQRADQAMALLLQHPELSAKECCDKVDEIWAEFTERDWVFVQPTVEHMVQLTNPKEGAN